MKRPRRNHSGSFKARIAKEALRGVKTVAQIAQENDLHPVQVSGWKKEIEANLSKLFERKNVSVRAFTPLLLPKNGVTYSGAGCTG